MSLPVSQNIVRTPSGKSSFFIKILNWEYWPIWLANIPLLFIVGWFALRARKIGFFAAANPAIETGGLFGESKINILREIPGQYLPKTIFVEKNTSFDWIKKEIANHEIGYPIIAKPDVGERGFLVTKIHDEAALKAYTHRYDMPFLIQEFVDLPLELAVMHHRLPNQQEGKITSICVKEPLQVTGDGVSTVRDLMRESDRAFLQLPRFEKDFPDLVQRVVKNGETILLEPIGNHCRGTAFLNGNHLINDKMEKVFNDISIQMKGMYYGRFDMKCSSPTAVENGDFRILEFNGVGAEPAHIYDDTIPVWKKYRDIYRHWRIIYRIFQLQKKNGITGDSLKDLRNYWQKYQQHKQAHEPLKK